LSNNSFFPEDEFSRHLLIEYKNKAQFEAEEMHDWNSAKLYSEKALKAVEGIKIKPEKIELWNLSQNHYLELKKAYDNLSQVYEIAFKNNPKNLAIAISSLDCWSEQQEEGWQTWDIEKCKNDYLKAMHYIYEEIHKNEKNNDNNLKNKTEKKSGDSVVLVTKNKNKKILQIIYFDFDKSKLTNVNIKEIKSFLDENKKNINKYLIVGHTDTKGKIDYNINLSLDRAKAVKNILINYGIEKNQIKLLGKGEGDLAIKTSDETAHPANRRVEISPIN
tara:strand:- start:12154 stop:12981 length:828 start_codon:yes stop_codon:yes gene_type:complete